MAFMGDVAANSQFELAFRASSRRRRFANGLRSHEEQSDILRSGRITRGDGSAQASLAAAGQGSWLDGLVKPGDILLPLEQEFFTRVLAHIGSLEEEVLLFVYLDRAGALIGDELIAGGTKCSHGIGYRRLFEKAFKRGAAALVLAHNHPSGSAEPSRQDISSTRALRALAVPMQMDLVDHLIVSSRAVFSMRTAGLLSD
jgi:DNA repair protein RadC